jgi:hypothetical protein
MKLAQWALSALGLRQETELDRQRAILRDRVDRIRELETRNALALASSRLERLEADGVPFYRDPTPPPLQQSRPALVPVLCYETNEAGFPYVPAVKFEQDPLFGWNDGNLIGWDLSSTVPVSAFPREMFPERPTTLRTQIAQDAIRFQSRAWFETIPQYSGPIKHLRNYIIGSGMTVDVVTTKNDENEEGPSYEQGEVSTATAPDRPDPDGADGGMEAPDPNKQLAASIQRYLDGFGKHRFNRIHRRLWDSVLNLFRDGEDALRLFPGKEFPEIRSVDTSTIRGPHNEINGPWAYGVLTSWPRDFEDVKAYHLWYSDNTHEDVSPNHLHLCKLDTTGSNVKRGVPLAYSIRKQLPQMAKLLDCMAVGEAARQAIPYIQQYSKADSSAVKAATPSWLDGNNPQYPGYNSGGNGNFNAGMLGGWSQGGDEIQPGAIQKINKGMEFQDPPVSANNQGGVLTYRTLCEALACALNVPLWFVTGSADSENYASSLVSESPVVQLIKHYQQLVTDHFRSVYEAVVEMAAALGKFPADWKTRVEIHCELPSPVARDPDKAVDSDTKLLDKKLLSPQHLCIRHGLDFDEETDLIGQAEANGWKAGNAMDLAQADQLLSNGGEDPPQPQEGE